MAFILFLFKIKKNFLIYKSIFASLFKNITSVTIIIIFYSITFSLVGAFYSYSDQIEQSVYPLMIDSKPNQVNYAGIYLNDLDRDEDYNNLFNFSVSYFNPDYVVSKELKTDDDLVDEYNLFFESEYGITNFWGTYGFLYFQDVENFITTLILSTTFYNFNSGLIDDEIEDNGAEYEVVYNFMPTYVYQPIVSDSYNEVYFLMGYNQFQTNWAPLFRYSGKNNNYIIDNMIISEYGVDQNGVKYDNQRIEEELTKVGNSYTENGTKEYPYQIIIQEEYVDANDIDLSNPDENLLKINDYYFQIMASACFSNVIFPVYSTTNFITDFSQQSTFLMNSESLAKISNGKLIYTFNYGFTDFYNNAAKSKDIYYYKDLGSGSDRHEYSEIHNRVYEFEDYIYYNTRTQGLPIFYSRSINFNDLGLITSEDYSLTSYRTTAVLDELDGETAFTTFFMYVFLIIIVFVLILLIQKRVKDYSKQFGTLKALGLNRYEASVSFIMYPFVIILISSFIALLLSIPLQIFLLGLFGSFFSLPALSWGFSFWSVFYVVFLPAFILFAIAVIIASFILRKSSIDLLSNKVNDDPSAIVVVSGKLVPKNASFSYAYKFKGLSRAWGKSLLLLFAIFIATMLTSLSFAAENMVTDTKELTSQGFNFEYYSSLNETKYNYDFYDLNPESDNYKNYEQEQQALYNNELFNADDINSIENNISSEPNNAYEEFGERVLEPINTEVISNDVANYYIPKEALLNFSIVINIFENNNNYELLQNDWAGSEYSANDFLSIINLFSINVSRNLNEFENDISFDDYINEVINEIKNNNLNPELLIYAPDIVFRDIFYDSTNQALATGGNVYLQYIDEDNSDNRFDVDYDSTRLNIFNDSDAINKVYALPEESENALKAEEEKVDDGEELDYIPVVVDSFTFNYLRLLKPNLFTYDPTDGTYITGDPTDDNHINDLYLTDRDNDFSREPVQIKVVSLYNSNLAVGFTTTEKLIQNYSGWNIRTNMNKIYYQNIYWSSYLPPQTLTITPVNQYTNATNGETITFEEYINNSKSLETAPFPKESIATQTDVLYNIINGFLLVLALFSLMVALILTVIAIKDVNDKSKKEVGMLKAIGYSNWKSTSLVLTPYLIIIVFGFILSIPFAYIMLIAISNVLTNLTGSTFNFAITAIQWIYITIFIVVLIFILLVMAYNAFRRTNPLDAIKEEN